MIITSLPLLPLLLLLLVPFTHPSSVDSPAKNEHQKNSSTSTESSTTTPAVKVYDNVLPDRTRDLLHKACVDWNNDDVVFEFPLQDPHGHSLIEQVLNDLLWTMYPNASTSNSMYYVEYWKRQSWHHILAHADMDEGLRNEQEEKGVMDAPFAHPETGHVLYLQLGHKVKGPTCVWENTTFGGSMMGIDDANTTNMIVVPAVESRLLRFQGHLLHAVPRPADLWLHPTHETEQGPDYERMVLLFNTWPTNHLLRGRTVTTPNDVHRSEKIESENTERSCHAFEEWKEVSLDDASPENDDNMVMIQFPLMGDERRRGTSAQTAVMETSSIEAHKAFDEVSKPTRIVVQPKRRKKKSSSWLSFMGIEF